jgi:glutamyl-tRNA synthetase
VVEALEWLGLVPDEGFWISQGQHQNIEFVQSERHKTGLYQKYADQLIEKGRAYRDWNTTEKLSKYRDRAKQDKQPFIFRRDMAKTDGDTNQPHVIRLDVPSLGQDKVEWQEVTRGDLHTDARIIDDFVIVKSDGFPTYNFANVVDDHEMNITHVLRGDEFIASTAKHILLYGALGLSQPQFVHLPVINGTDGKKLSKRSGDTDVLEYKKKGYQPEALLNFLALLGWNDGTEQEIFTLDELAAKFKLEQINTSPAVFDAKRLDWISGHHVRAAKLDELYALVSNSQFSVSNQFSNHNDQKKSYWPEAAKNYPETYKKQVLGLLQERLKYLAEIPELSEFFFKDLAVDPSLIASHKKLKKYDKAQLKELLEQTKESLAQSDFSVDDLRQRLNKLLETTGEKPIVIFSLIRIATTQAAASPQLAPTLHVLGKEKSLGRIDQQIAELT